MPSINMIATRRSEKQRFESNMRRLIVVILAEVVLGVVLGVMFTVKICGTRARIDDMDVQLQRLAPVVKQIKDYESATARLNPKVELLQQAQNKTLRWRGLLDELSRDFPAQTWLTKIGVNAPSPGSGQKGGMTVSLSGLSANQNQVGEAMLRMNTCPDFKSVELHYTQPASIGKRRAVQFEIAASLKEEKTKEGSKDNGKS